MKKEDPGKDRMQAFSLMPGMHLHIADFKPPETIEQTFETTNPVLRFYFYTSVCGYWELRSPYRPGSQNRITYTDRLSSVRSAPPIEPTPPFPICMRMMWSVSGTPGRSCAATLKILPN
jgi:hypothetical protein